MARRYGFGLTVFLILFFQVFTVKAEEWPQDAHDAARTGTTNEDPGNGSNWSFAWFFKSPANSNPPREGRSVTGGGKVYLPAGSHGLYALGLTNGSVVWNVAGTFNATPAYASGYIYAGDTSGRVLKVNSGNGMVTATYTAGSPVNKSILIAGNYVYVISDDGKLHKIQMSDMSVAWVYNSASGAATPPSYSLTRDMVVFATSDLYVHAVNSSTGVRKWRVKPTPNMPGSPNSAGWTTFERAWPVIAEKNGVVLLRMQLPHQAHFDGPNGGRFGNTNAESRSWLVSNPQRKNLFALDINDGSERFVPAVGYGSTEDYIGGTSVGVMGTQPVVKAYSSGEEVAYIPFRSFQGSSPDYRWSGHMGEMVLDDTAISGLVAGDLRFIKMNRLGNGGGNSYIHIIDEQAPITLAGNALLHAHWGASEGIRITNRSQSLGLTYSNPVTSVNLPVIIRAQNGCGDVTTHKANCGLSLVDDGRFWDGPGFFEYLGIRDLPLSPVSTAYSAGFLPRHTYVSDGYVIAEGNGGDLLVLSHGGSVAPTSALSPTVAPTVQTKLGDANYDGKVDGIDYVVWLNHYNLTTTLGSRDGDFNIDGKVDGIDYVVWLNNYGF